MVLASPLMGLPQQNWPGVWTLLPVAGSALIVWGGPPALVARVADSAPVQRIGDWSYSIYLWHWPLWVFMQQWAVQHGNAVELPHKLLLVAASVALGWLSCKYIEQPVRQQRGFWRPSRLWIGYVLVLAALTAFTLAAVKTQGFPDRVPSYQQRVDLAKRVNTPRDECFRNAQSEKRASVPFCEFGAAAGPLVPDVVLWGDSHANQYLVPVSVAASQAGLHGIIATQSGCRAFLVETPGAYGVPAACERFNQQVLGLVAQSGKPGVVVLARNWGGAASVGEAFALVRHLLAAGRTVVLVLPLLDPGFDVPERWMREQFKAAGPVDELRADATRPLLQQDVKDEIRRQAAGLAGKPGFFTVDPASRICTPAYCYLVREGLANFRDTLHISNTNASQYNDIFVKVLLEAADNARGRETGKTTGSRP